MTLYRRDSTADFFLHCLSRYPSIITTLPRTDVTAIGFLLGREDKTSLKRNIFRFLEHVPDVPAEVERFWSTHEALIAGPCSPVAGDIVISASPEFLLKDVCEKRGWTLIASRVDPNTGIFTGKNCSGKEKVRRFREQFPDAVVEEFYSDSLVDTPMAREARKAFLVKGDKLLPWPKK